MQKHKYPSLLDTKEHLQNWGTFSEDSWCFCLHFDNINYQKISSIKLISLILLIFSCSYDFLSSLRLFCYCLLENFLIRAALQMLTSELPHWDSLTTAYLRISSLRLPHNCLLENFLVEADLWLLIWKVSHWGCRVTAYLRISSLRLVAKEFPYEGYLFIETSFLRIFYWGCMIKEACLRLTEKSFLF